MAQAGKSPSPEGDEDRGAARLARYQAAALAWNLGWPIAAGVVAGSWLDGRLGTSPLFILAFTLGALVATVRRLLQLTSRSQRGDV